MRVVRYEFKKTKQFEDGIYCDKNSQWCDNIKEGRRNPNNQAINQISFNNQIRSYKDISLLLSAGEALSPADNSSTPWH